MLEIKWLTVLRAFRRPEMSIAQLKKGFGDISKLQNKLGEMKNKKAESEEVYWKLTVDASGVGEASIRLLPAAPNEDYPFVKVKDYGIGVFNKEAGKKKWYIQRSLESVGKQDPVKDEFWACYNLGTDHGKELMKQIRDREYYIVWIYVISDKNAPQNNGKVMKAKLSPSIWKLVEEQISPQFETDEPLNVFDPWNGATLNLRAYNGSNGMRSYDKSKWLSAGPLFKDDDEKLDEVYSQVKGLDYEIDPANPHYTKSYDELSAKLELVLGRPLYKDKDKQNSGAAIEDAFNDEEELSNSNSLGTSYSTNSPQENDVRNILNSSDDDDAELRALLED